jgi:hypothetical protein
MENVLGIPYGLKDMIIVNYYVKSMVKKYQMFIMI